MKELTGYKMENTLCRALGKTAQARTRVIRVLDLVGPGKKLPAEGEMRSAMLELSAAMTELYLAAAAVDCAYEMCNREMNNARDIRHQGVKCGD